MGGRSFFVCFVAFVAGFFVPFVAAGQNQGELIERTLALVAGRVITLSDVRAVDALGLSAELPTVDATPSTLDRLIERRLVLSEVQRYAPPEPGAEAVQARVDRVRERVGAGEAFEAALAAGGFSEARLRDWIRDDLRIAAYLDSRFAVAGIPSDQDIAAYFNDHRAEFERGGLTYDDAFGLIRDRLAAERRRDLIIDWIADLRRRSEVILIS